MLFLEYILETTNTYNVIVILLKIKNIRRNLNERKSIDTICNICNGDWDC
jgi:hypothetical protein